MNDLAHGAPLHRTTHRPTHRPTRWETAPRSSRSARRSRAFPAWGRRLRAACPLGLVLVAACELTFPNAVTDDQSGLEDGLDLPAPSAFRCDDVEGAPLACVDFNDGERGAFEGEGGTWEVRDGRLIGFGPDEVPGPCSGSLMTHAIHRGIEAQDVSAHVELVSAVRVDKALVLRSTGPENRVQINFRARDAEGDYGDLMIQEIRDCAFVMHTADNEIPLPHENGERLVVDVDLIGARLTVRVNDEEVFDGEVPFPVRSGEAGVAIINGATTAFDDFIVWGHDEASEDVAP